MCYVLIMPAASNSAPTRTVVLLRPSEKRRLQKLARDEKVSASEIVRRSIHAYQSSSTSKGEQDMRGLIACFAKGNYGEPCLDQEASGEASMTVASDLFSIVKKIFLVSDELTRLSIEVKELTRAVNDHDVRLAVIENTLSLTRRSTAHILPGN
jgi:hypothetical protein